MGAKRFRNFPSEELVEQILQRLHCTKTMLRCTLVCKSWRSLIKSSEFINTLLSSPNNKKYLLWQDDKYSLHSDTQPSEQCCRLLFPKSLECIDVHGCCNGVICYTDPGGNPDIVHLWNPCIRKLKVLPESRKPGQNKALGFWFNAEKNDYEVVKIAYTGETSAVEVYSLNGGSWKMINVTCPGAEEIRDVDLVYAKGKLHWLAKQKQGWMIVSLDMSNAKFREKLISGPCPEATKFYLTQVHANSLAILRYGLSLSPYGFQQDGCTVEVYDENLTICSRDLYDSRRKTLHPVGFRNNGEALLIQIPCVEKMVTYDFGAKQFRDFDFCGQSPASACPYVKSLVLLNDMDVHTTTAAVLGNKFI